MGLFRLANLSARGGGKESVRFGIGLDDHIMKLVQMEQNSPAFLTPTVQFWMGDNIAKIGKSNLHTFFGFSG